MPETVTKTETCNDTTTIVTTDSATNRTTTQQTVDNCTKTTTFTRGDRPCPCGHLDLERLVEQTRCWAFKSSNLAAANSNAVLIFALQVLQEILIHECRNKNATINQIFLITTAIAEIAEIIRVYNPSPFNS